MKDHETLNDQPGGERWLKSALVVIKEIKISPLKPQRKAGLM
jgi:hypothetical protein